jgi:hypothetical protein
MGFHKRLKELWERSSLTDRIIAFFTGVLAGAAIYQFIIMGGQLDVMREDQRAWVSGAEIFVNNESRHIEANKLLDVRFILQNTGKTPALNTRFQREWRYAIADQPVFVATLQTVDWSKSPTAAVGFVSPGSKTVYTDYKIEESLPPMFYDEIMSNKRHLFVAGKVTYCDVFNTEHWVTYCYHLLSGGGWAACENGNDMDPPQQKKACSVVKPN